MTCPICWRCFRAAPSICSSSGWTIGKESFCGHPLTTTEEESVWLAPRQDGKGLYCALFNLSDEARTVRVSPGQLGYPAVCARELWTGREKSAAEGITARLPAHDAAVYLLTF